MTSPNLPPGDPEYTSEPMVLSPVSPKPLHYPTPQNIPILEKQIDQAFNQTSAHMAQAATRQQQEQQQQQPSQPQGTEQQTNASTAFSSSSVAGQNGDARVEYQQWQAVEPGENVQGQAQDTQPDSQMNHASSDYAPAEPNMAFASAFAPEPPPSEPAPAPAPAQASNEPIPTSEHIHHAFVDSTPPNANVSAQSLVSTQIRTPEAQSQGVPVEPPPSGADDDTHGVQFQTDFLSQANPPTATAPDAEGITIPTTSSPNFGVVQPAPGTASDVANTVLAGPPPGLPPKPPAQEQPSMHPSYDHATDIRAYHPHSQHAPPQSNLQQSAVYQQNTQSSAYPPAPGQSIASSAAGLPPPPVASFQQQQQQQPVQRSTPAYSESPTAQATRRQRELESQREIKIAAGETLDEADIPWTPETQRKYDVFLNEERKYVTEGNWEQFPQGSRLFVGNLSSERVTKRDIFHVFHKYGDLAQISIKQAYGFVQYLQTDSCSKAMQVEQGKTIRGKKIHLEVSKPQKNRPTDAKGERRSRSPERGGRRGGSPNVDRYQPSPQDRRNNDARNNNRRGGGRNAAREDQYRPGGRSPSPPGRYRNNHRSRSRSRSRHRYESRYRSRSRSPYGRNGARYRSPTPHRSEDEDLPLPRRRPESVPDVQIIVLDSPDRDFIAYVERAFAARSIRVDVLFLSPRLSLDAVIKRQVLEGVVAVSKLTRLNQLTVKIPLQIFDRRIPSDVRFDEYQDLDPNVAAELVSRAKTAAIPVYQQSNPMMAPPVQYGYAGLPPPQLPPAVTSATQPHHLGNLISSLDPTALQKLLGVMQPSPLSPQHPHIQQQMAGVPPELAKLLGSSGVNGVPPHPVQTSMQQQQSHLAFTQNGGFQPHQHQHPQQLAGMGAVGGIDPLAALRANPALANLLAQGQPATPVQGMGIPQPGQQQHQMQTPQPQPGQQQHPQQKMAQGQPDMAEILARLGNYGRT